MALLLSKNLKDHEVLSQPLVPLPKTNLIVALWGSAVAFHGTVGVYSRYWQFVSGYHSQSSPRRQSSKTLPSSTVPGPAHAIFPYPPPSYLRSLVQFEKSPSSSWSEIFVPQRVAQPGEAMRPLRGGNSSWNSSLVEVIKGYSPTLDSQPSLGFMVYHEVRILCHTLLPPWTPSTLPSLTVRLRPSQSVSHNKSRSAEVDSITYDSHQYVKAVTMAAISSLPKVRDAFPPLIMLPCSCFRQRCLRLSLLPVPSHPARTALSWMGSQPKEGASAAFDTLNRTVTSL